MVYREIFDHFLSSHVDFLSTFVVLFASCWKVIVSCMYLMLTEISLEFARELIQI